MKIELGSWWGSLQFMNLVRLIGMGGVEMLGR